MDQLTTVSHEYMLSLWTTRIKECKSSGMTVVAWCKINNIGIKNYYYWMRKIKREAFEEFSLGHNDNNSSVTASNSPVFSKINLLTNQPKICSAVTVHLNGFTIGIQDGASESTILNTLRAIRSLC